MNFNQKAYELGSKRSVIREIFEYSKKRGAEIGMDKVYDFSLGNPSVEPPKEVTKTLINLLNKENPTALHGYTSAQGDAICRDKIAKDLNKKYNSNFSADNIYFTCGAAASLSITLKALITDSEEECMVVAPFFTEYRVFVGNAGAKLVVVNPTPKTFQVDLEDFKAKITPKTKAVIINSPNNPSGVVYTEETIKNIAKILTEKQAEYGKSIYLVTDEPYRELMYGGEKYPFVTNYYDNSVVCYSFSKSLSLPGERIGYIAVNPACDGAKELYLAVCGAGRELGYVCAPSIFQRVVTENLDAKVNLEAYKTNRDLIYNGLTKIGYECVKPDGAFYLFVKALEDDAFKFFEKAKKHELLVVPCDDFGVKGYVRNAYCVSKERIINSLPEFKKLFDEYNK